MNKGLQPIRLLLNYLSFCLYYIHNTKANILTIAIGTRMQIASLNSLEIFTKDFLISDAAVLQQCKDGFRSVVNTRPQIFLMVII